MPGEGGKRKSPTALWKLFYWLQSTVEALRKFSTDGWIRRVLEIRHRLDNPPFDIVWLLITTVRQHYYNELEISSATLPREERRSYNPDDYAMETSIEVNI